MRLSVVIPTFERSEILQMTLTALSEQAVPKKEFEVIVVDDGSNDKGKTKKTVESFYKKNPNFRYVRQKNQRQGMARNNGVKRAKGEIVLFLGDDHKHGYMEVVRFPSKN